MKRCDVCEFSTEHGHYPPGVAAHCPGCHRSWRGMSEEHCTSCHRHFGGDVAFQAHQAGDSCRDPLGLTTRDGAQRFRPITRKDGLVWVKADQTAYPAKEAS